MFQQWSSKFSSFKHVLPMIVSIIVSKQLQSLVCNDNTYLHRVIPADFYLKTIDAACIPRHEAEKLSIKVG